MSRRDLLEHETVFIHDTFAVAIVVVAVAVSDTASAECER